MANNQIDFGSGKVSTLFRQVFVPTLFGMLSLSAVTMIDGIFVGHGVGSDGIAAVNICIPLLMVLQGTGLMIGAGCSVLASIDLSQGRVRMARARLTQAMVFVTIIAVIAILAIMLFPTHMAYILGSSEHLLPLVKDYMIWFAPSLLFQMWTEVSLFSIRLDGAPRLAMWCSITSAVLNAVLDWLFIFPLCMGVMGAALATLICCFVGAMIAVVYMLFYARKMRLHPLHLSRRGLSFFGHDIAEQCKVGFSTLLNQMTMAMLFFVGNHVFMRYLGDDGVGAFGISCYYMPFVFMIGNAIAQSAQPIISYNFGLGQTSRVHEALRVSLETAVVCGILLTLLFMFCPQWLVALFLDTTTPAAQMAIEGFPYYCTGFVFFVLNLAAIGYYQSVERVIPATAFALLRGVVFLVPCFLLLPEVLGIKGIWLALAQSECLTTAVIVLSKVLLSSPSPRHLRRLGVISSLPRTSRGRNADTPPRR